MTIKEELTLVEQAKAGLQAFDVLYDYYFDRIYKYTVSRTGNHSIAEDIVSEVFLRAIEKIRSFDTSRNIRFGSWLYKTSHNLIIDKSRKIRAEISLDEIEIPVESSTDRDVFRDVIRKQVTITLSKLRPRYQQIISLRFYAELEFDEIATIMETSKENVALIFHRASKRFRKIFKKNFPESEIFELPGRYI
jgi:RNA polymerase sigma-70 factor (ECF subfamily)